MARILDAAGHEIVLIETVGVGQDEIEVVKAADLVVVVCVPGQGDGVQTLKAGIMEIADLFVVNKADREGADELVADIRSMLALTGDRNGEAPPVLETCALSGEGVDALVAALLERADRASASGQRAEARVREEILTLIERELARVVRRRFGSDSRLDEAVRSRAERRERPLQRRRGDPRDLRAGGMRRTGAGPWNEANELLTERRDRIGVLIFNRPERRNALSPRLLIAVHESLEAWAGEDEIRTVVIRGAGEKAFSAGYDILAIPTDVTPETASRLRDRNPLQLALESVKNFPYPTIAMLNGHCFGGAVHLALCCDLRIGADDIAVGILRRD